MNSDKIKLLSMPFLFEEVEAKVQITSKDASKGLRGMVVFYLDSRTIQKRLDEVLGHLNWKNQYVEWKEVEVKDPRDKSVKTQKSQLCGIAIYNEERKEWVPKYDGAECSDIEPIKGGLSDSFKRAACMWGIGRYLYEMEGIWVGVEQRGNSCFVQDNQKGILKAAYDDAVKRIMNAGTNQGESQQATKSNATGAEPAVINNQSANNPANQQQSATVAQQNATVKTPASQASKDETKSTDNDIPIHDFKIHSMKPAGKASQLLELCNPDGKITPAYVRSDEKGIATGAYLRNVKLEEKSNEWGIYNLLTGYEVASVAAA